MFWLILRVISAWGIFLFFGIIIISSFFSNTQNTQSQDITSLFNSTGSLYTATWSEYYVQQNSSLETLFSTQKVSNIQSQDQKITVNLHSSGSYISSFRDLRKEYIFQADDFDLIQKGIWEIYIDFQIDSQKVLIFPLTSSAELVLKDALTGEIYTKIFLTPHMYIEFDPARGKFLKNADALRVKTVFKIGYFPMDISKIEQDTFLKSWNLTKEGFFIKVLGIIHWRDKKMQSQLNILKGQNITKISWYETIERYANIFVNKEKKKIFYKNIILEQYFQLISLQRFSKENLLQLKNDLLLLESIDREGYQEMLDIQEFIFSLLLTNPQKEYAISKLSFALLSAKNLSEEKGYFYIYANSLFSLYDTKSELSWDLIWKFLQSFLSYSIQDNKDIQAIQQRYHYFLFFLEKQLVFLLSQDTSDNTLLWIIDTLKNYIDISDLSYDASATSRITSLYMYDALLKDIDIFLRTQYFSEKRNEQDLLVLGEKKMKARDITSFREQIEKIFSLHLQFEKFLDATNTRDISISQDITQSKLRITEYFIALENYQSYASQYSSSNKDILPADTPTIDEKEMSISEITQYLSQFIGVNMESVIIEIREWFYHIENVSISGKEFSFDLYPYSSSYKMKNIYIDGQERWFVYDLNQDSFDSFSEFQEFFLNTFFTNGEGFVETYEDDDVQITEDKTEIILKRDILIGKEWLPILTFIPIKYENILLTRKVGWYDIYVDSIPVNLWWFTAFFEGNYIYSTTDHYFKNPSFIFSQGWFSGIELVLIGKINLGEIETIFLSLKTDILILQSIYNTVIEKYPTLSNVSFQYMHYLKKMTIKFDYEWKKYTISFAGDTIEKIYIWTNNILIDPIDIQEISSYLP